MSHVFISYVKEDGVLVERLAAELRELGVEVWLDKDNIQPGSRWQTVIEDAIRNGSYFICCFSKAYSKKQISYMNEELTVAIDALRLRGHESNWFLPVLLDECNVPAIRIGRGETLIDIQWTALFQDWEKGVQRICEVVSPIEKSYFEGQILNAAVAIEAAQMEKRMNSARAHFRTPTLPPSYEYSVKEYEKLRKIYVRRFRKEFNPLLDNIELVRRMVTRNASKY